MNHTVFGQADTLAFATPDSEKVKTKIYSIQTITNVGFILPPKDNTNYRIQYGKSVQGLLGCQLYVKLAKFYKMGVGLAFSGNLYNIRQDNGKWFIDTNLYRKELFTTGDLSLAFAHQFRLNKERLPLMLEASVYGAYIYSGKHKVVSVDYNPDDIYSGKIRTKTIHRELTYLEHWIWGLQLRLTYRGVGLYAQYRMNHLVKLGRPEDYASFDMPSLSIGLTFSEEVFNF
jgi:hypothetical protein